MDEDHFIYAVAIANREGKISTATIQRKLNLGYGRARAILDRMLAEGIVSEPERPGAPCPIK